MKKLLALSFIGTSFFITSSPLKADWDYWAVKENSNPDLGLDFFTVDNATGTATLRTTKCFKNDDYLESTCMLTTPSTQNYIEPSTGDIYWQDPNSRMQSYNLETDTWTDRGASWKPNYDSTYARPNVVGTSGGGAKIELDGTKLYELKSDGSVQIGSDSNDIDISTSGLNIGGSSVIKKNSDGSIQIGTDTNDIDISGEGLLVDGVSLITKKDSGEIHIGKNSLITIEENSVQKLYAKDENGDAININVTNGSDLLIDGTGVQSQITSNATNITSNDTDIASNASNISSNDTDISALQGLISTKSGSTTTARIGDSTKNTLEIGPTTNPTTIDQSGISVSGGNLIKKDSDGNIHIGKNSFVIGNDVLNGAHPIWAEDENGTKIPLNIYGSDLHINGKSVQGQIDTNKSNIKNLGSGVAGSTALTAALTALPHTSKESKLSCGVGSAAYSSRYAFGFGCASKVNERVDINAGGSYVFGGSKSYGEGTLDSGVVKAGFVFKLGELKNANQISMKEKKELKQEISILKENNQNILAQNQALLARLERLEKIALGESNSPDLVLYKLK